MTEGIEEKLALGARLSKEVLEPMKRDFIGKDEVIDLLGVALVGGENLFILGPPGTAKTALVHGLSRRLHGASFDYLLTRFTEPSELFGPFDIRKLREGELVTNTEGMLPEASLVFLDELLNANSAILNSLLMALNERIFRRGRETRALQALMFVGASNHLPEDDALRALFDRFLLRVHCDNVESGRLAEVLDAGWKLNRVDPRGAAMLGFDDVRKLQSLGPDVHLGDVKEAYVSLILKIREAGIPISDRRAVRLQRLVAASALLCGRIEARISDLWILRFIWDVEEQRELLNELVNHTVTKVEAAPQDHPRSRVSDMPDAEAMARDLDAMEKALANHLPEAERSVMKDRLSLLDGRSEWVSDPLQKEELRRKVANLWEKLG